MEPAEGNSELNSLFIVWETGAKSTATRNLHYDLSLSIEESLFPLFMLKLHLFLKTLTILYTVNSFLVLTILNNIVFIKRKVSIYQWQRIVEEES